jgi:hypothetical protein
VTLDKKKESGKGYWGREGKRTGNHREKCREETVSKKGKSKLRVEKSILNSQLALLY